MDVTRERLQIVERAHSLGRILEAGVRLIAERLRVDSCSAFLIDEHGELFRRAPGDSERWRPGDTHGWRNEAIRVEPRPEYCELTGFAFLVY